MKFVIFGAGAVGGVLGARLALAGEDVTLIARGRHLEALKRNGLRVRSKVFGDMECHPAATDKPAEVGPADVVFLAVKAHSVPSVASKLDPLMGKQTIVVTLQNGFPWWYFYKLPGKWEGRHLESVDPGRVTARHIDIDRIIAGLAYCAAGVSEPGVVEHLDASRFPLGELDGSRSKRVKALSKLMSDAGLKSPIRRDIRQDIWVKLLGNVPFNPISAITRADFEQMLGFPPARHLVWNVMEEVRAVAAALGVSIPISSERRIAGAEEVGPHRTSMLQDLDAGRPPELEPIVGAVVELAGMVKVEIPNLSVVYACAKLLFNCLENRPAIPSPAPQPASSHTS